MDYIATVLAEAMAFVQLSFGRHACSSGLAVSHEVTTHARSRSYLHLPKQLNSSFCKFTHALLYLMIENWKHRFGYNCWTPEAGTPA